jgi:hypothetical protein
MYALEILTGELVPTFEYSFDEVRTLVPTMSFPGNPFGLSLHDSSLNLYHTRDMVLHLTWLFFTKNKSTRLLRADLTAMGLCIVSNSL